MHPNTDPKDKFNKKAYKHAIGMIESSGGVNLDSKTSSAAGKYHFLWNLIKDDDSLDGVSKREFIANPELQESIMDKALDGNLKGYPNYVGYANKLKGEYKSELGTPELAALTHFLGMGNVRKYLSDPKGFQVKGKNLSPDAYLQKFDGYFQSSVDSSPKAQEPQDTEQQEQLRSIRDKEVQNTMQPVDNTRVAQKDISPQQFVMGGPLKEVGSDGQGLTRFEAGGTHEQNPIGGIPQGVGADGSPNLVEEGETKWNDYIFSNAISLDGSYDLSTRKGMEDGGEIDPTNDFMSFMNNKYLPDAPADKTELSVPDQIGAKNIKDYDNYLLS